MSYDDAYIYGKGGSQMVSCRNGHPNLSEPCPVCASTSASPVKQVSVAQGPVPNRNPNPDPDWTTCSQCGRYPAIPINIRRANFALIYMRLNTAKKVALCKECGRELIKGMQIKNGTSMLTNPFFGTFALATNTRWYAKLSRLPDPYEELPNN